MISLFYLEENSQQDVAAFLEMSVNEVNNCLYAARKTLKGRINYMFEQKNKSKMLPKDFATDIGKIIKVQGRVIDIEVNSSLSPNIFDDYKLQNKSDSKITVVQRLKDGRIRCIVSGEFGELNTNSKIKNEKESSFPSWNEDSINDAIKSIGTNTHERLEIFETGIKVIDLLCPFPKNGNIGMIGSTGVGKFVVITELYKKFLKESGQLSIFFFVSPQDAINVRSLIEQEPILLSDESGPLKTAWLITPNAADPEFAEHSNYLDACLYFSPVMALTGRWPAIDPIRSTSKVLDPLFVETEHFKTANQVKELLVKEDELMKDPIFYEYLAMGSKQKANDRFKKFEIDRFNELSKSNQNLVMRARKIKNFLTQPFFITEEYTKVKGVSVNLRDTIIICQKIISGEFDELSAESFLYVGGDIKVKS